jgi:ComF family protein
MLLELKNIALDTLFPISCLGCGQPERWICNDCLEKIPLLIDQVCPLCEKKITPNGYTCFGCQRKYTLDGLLVSSSYQNKLLSHAVHLYKYRFIESLSESLGEIMLKAILSSEMPLPDIITSVPLHKRRLRLRGFNQSGLLAEYVAKGISPGFPVEIINNLLIRQRYTQPQMKIKNYRQRKNNIKGAFTLDRKNVKKVKGKRILLVDDVATTGATIFECAETLKRKGAKEVFAVVLARQALNKI